MYSLQHIEIFSQLLNLTWTGNRNTSKSNKRTNPKGCLEERGLSNFEWYLLKTDKTSLNRSNN